MWLQIEDYNDLQEGDIIELGTEYPLLLHYGVVVVENNEKKCAHYPYPQGPCIENLNYVINNRPDNKIRGVIRTGIKSEEIIQKHDAVKNDFKDNFPDWVNNNCEDYIRKVTGTPIGTDQRIYFVLGVILILLIIIILIK